MSVDDEEVVRQIADHLEWGYGYNAAEAERIAKAVVVLFKSKRWVVTDASA